MERQFQKKKKYLIFGGFLTIVPIHTIHALMRAANTKNGAEDPHYWISCHVFTTASTGLSYLQTLGDIQK